MAKIDLIHTKALLEKISKSESFDIETELEDGFLNVKVSKSYEFSVYEDGTVTAWESFPATWAEPGYDDESEIGSVNSSWEVPAFLITATVKEIVSNIADAEAEVAIDGSVYDEAKDLWS